VNTGVAITVADVMRAMVDCLLERARGLADPQIVGAHSSVCTVTIKFVAVVKALLPRYFYWRTGYLVKPVAVIR
jgi:hypothetical protein